MRVFIAVLVLTFGLQSLTKADDIRDFQIEGMGVGDSLLDYYSEEEIKSRIFEDYPGSDKFKRFYSYKHESFKTYEGVQVNFKKNDKKYIIHALAGQIDFPNNIQECLKLKKKIVKDFEAIFFSAKKYSETNKKRYDKTGKSISYITQFHLPSKDSATIECSDWSDKITKKTNLDDNINVRLETKKFGEFLMYDAFN